MLRFIQKYFSEWFPVERIKTDYNVLEVIRQNNKLVLNAQHTNYSFGGLHDVFRNAFQQIHPDFQKIKNVLMLGFGAGSVAWILQKENRCACQITGVEIDATIIALAKKYFRLDHIKNLDLHIADAADFISVDTNRYDLIVIDLFLDHRTPKKFLTAGFLESLQKHLLPQGIILFNYLLYDFEARKKSIEFEKNFRYFFQQIQKLTFRKQSKNIVFSGRR